MTIPAGERSTTKHIGNGVADTFDYEFKITDETDLLVVTVDDQDPPTDTTLELNVDYTVSGVGEQGGGSITLIDGPLPVDYEIYINDNLPIAQETPYANQSAFFANLHERSFDDLTRMVRRLADGATLSIRIPASFLYGDIDTTLPPPEAFNYIRWNADANKFENVPLEEVTPPKQAGDYSNDMITNVSGVGGAFTSDALDNLAAGLTTLGLGLDELTIRVSAAEGDINSLQIDVAQLQSDLSTLDATTGKLAGDNRWTGQNDFEGVINVLAPTQDPHAATKKYVDDTTTAGTQPGAGLTRTGDTLDVGQGTGIVVNPDDVAFDQDYGDNRYMQPPEDLLERSVIINEDKFPAQDTDGNRFSIQWGNAIANLADPLRARGAWDAESNIVTLDPLNTTLAKGQPPESDGADPVGWFYIVNKPGVFDLTDDPGPESWQLNDKALWLETGWARIPGPAGGSGTVETVFGRPGPDVVAEDEDYPASLITNDSLVAGDRVSDALNNLDLRSNAVMTAADFFALAEKRIRDNVGSGVVEWGDNASGVQRPNVNEGITVVAEGYETVALTDAFSHGYSGNAGVSRTIEPIYDVNGAKIHVFQVNQSTIVIPGAGLFANIVVLPPAPDGLDKADGTGRFADLAEAIAAGGTELSGSVINRQDPAYVMMRETVVSDRVYPLGNRQYGLNTWEGIPLVLSDAPENRFGEWDSTTTGYYLDWENLTDEQKRTVLQDPKNNLYLKDGQLVYREYKIRTVQGLEGDWTKQGIHPIQVGGKYLQPNFDNEGVDLGDNNPWSEVESDPGILVAGDVYMVPICMVSRHNQGAFDKELNERGVRLQAWDNTDSGFVDSYGTWYNAPNVTKTLSDMFNFVTVGEPLAINTVAADGRPDSGAIGDPATKARDDGQFYDAIYAAYVQDLRVRADEKPEDEIREMYHRKAIANEARGWEKVVFTECGTGNVTASSNGNIGNLPSDPNPRMRFDANPFNNIFQTLNEEVDEYARPDIKWYVYNKTDNLIYKVHSLLYLASDSFNMYQEPTWLQPGDPDFTTNPTIGKECYFIAFEWKEIRAQEHTWTDIIGDPERIAATFPNGGYFQWVPVIADGTSKDFPANRKYENRSFNLQWTRDNGATWNSVPPTPGNDTKNLLRDGDTLRNDQTELHHYTTSAHFTEDWDNSSISNTEYKVWTSIQSGANKGNILTSSLINKAPIGGGGGAPRRQEMPLTTIGIDYTADGDIIFSSGSSSAGNVHPPVIVESANGPSPAVKTLDYLSSTNGKYDLVMAYKEMIYKAVGSIEVLDQKSVTLSHGQVGKFTQPGSLLGQAIKSVGGAVSGLDMSNWGVTADGTVLDQNDNPRSDFVSWDGDWWNDNNQFEITDGQSTLVNDAGDTVLYGTARLQDHIVQYFRPQHKEAGPEVTATAQIQPVDKPEDGIEPVEES